LYPALAVVSPTFSPALSGREFFYRASLNAEAREYPTRHCMSIGRFFNSSIAKFFVYFSMTVVAF